jgi:hypothetical protein
MRYLCASALNRTFEKIWESNFVLICYGQSTRFAQSQIQGCPLKIQSLAILRLKSLIDAMNSHALAEAMVCSKSLAGRQGEASRLAAPRPISKRAWVSDNHSLLSRHR